MKDFNIKKLYYSISEVSKITGVEQYVLRFWETEFDQLKPQKSRSGNRIYTNKEIELIMVIKSLLKDKKFTIEGAKKELESSVKKPIVETNVKSSELPSENQLEKAIDFTPTELGLPIEISENIFGNSYKPFSKLDDFASDDKKKLRDLKKDLVEVRNFLEFLVRNF